MRSLIEIATYLSVLLLPSFLNASSSGSGACAYISSAEDSLTVKGEAGQCGGRLVIAKHSEPKTFNPLTAPDGISRDIIGLMMADLIHVNRDRQETEAA